MIDYIWPMLIKTNWRPSGPEGSGRLKKAGQRVVRLRRVDNILSWGEQTVLLEYDMFVLLEYDRDYRSQQSDVIHYSIIIRTTWTSVWNDTHTHTHTLDIHWTHTHTPVCVHIPEDMKLLEGWHQGEVTHLSTQLLTHLLQISPHIE